ncbi:ferredoxin [Parafrankia sp. FMc2]|uniref:ferredoxin n=1 Tax=Parafrankia sp. FMc2 TaxID=3233196 RepID=UPI0034D597D5
MKISIDSELCQGHGRCYELAPSLVTDDERGRGTVMTPEVPDELLPEARAAANACPERALLLSE